MFKRLNKRNGPFVTVTIEGRRLSVPANDSVAAAMLAAGVLATRTTPVSGDPRGPFCMMGACFECLVEIDGVPNQQACQTPVRDGMNINVQKGARDVES